MANLSASYHDIDALDDAMRAAMFALFKRYYASVSMDRFIRDLEGKTIAILLRDAGGELQGFSTLEVINFETDNGPATALYSGDTIISHHHWGEQQLSYAWCYFAGQIKAEQPDVPLYWFLIVKGASHVQILAGGHTESREGRAHAQSEARAGSSQQTGVRGAASAVAHQ